MGRLRRIAHDFGNAFFRCWRKVNWLLLANLMFLVGSIMWLVSPILCWLDNDEYGGYYDA